MAKIKWIGITIVAMAITVLLLIGYDVISFEQKPETHSLVVSSNTPRIPHDYRIVTIKGVEYKIDIKNPFSGCGFVGGRENNYYALDENNKRIENTIIKYREKDNVSHWEVEITPEEEPTTINEFDPTNLPKAE